MPHSRSERQAENISQQRSSMANSTPDACRDNADRLFTKKRRARSLAEKFSKLRRDYPSQSTNALRQCVVSRYSLKLGIDLDQVASEAGLAASSHARPAKARRMLPAMIETIVFFCTLIASRALALKYTLEIVQVWRIQLVASFYRASVAHRNYSSDRVRVSKVAMATFYSDIMFCGRSRRESFACWVSSTTS